MQRLKKTLNAFYGAYDFHERLRHDPLEIPHRYSRRDDQEVAGFIASCFAYGKVSLFKPVIEKIVSAGGKHPAEFVRNFDLKKDRKYVRGLRYRFNSEKDVLCLLYLLREVLNEWGSLEALFAAPYGAGDEDVESGLHFFSTHFLGIDTSPVYGAKRKPPGLTQFFPSPRKGSSCKRMNLFLRWMVRRSDIDLGIWKRLSPDRLIIPLDTHVGKVARCLGLTERRSGDWRTAGEITASLRKMDGRDPLKYDFVLCHHGMSRQCTGDRSTLCSSCVFFSI